MRPYITVTGMAPSLTAVWATLVHAALGTGQPSATSAPASLCRFTASYRYCPDKADASYYLWR
jgi:hypothetical protein